MRPKELTVRGLVLGALLTLVFTAANVYLGLRVGLTFASSIPAAVISMAILSAVKDSSILENNIVQTVASAAGTLSAIIFVLPGLVIVGWWTGFPFWQSFLICVSGGVLGVLFTIPLRRALVTTSDLPYPEGVAAAEVLKVGSGTRGETKDDTGEAREGLTAVSAINTPGLSDPVPIPLRPIWTGIVINTLLYATIWYALWLTLTLPRKFFKEVSRLRDGRCIGCGYDLGYDFVQGCPECGWRRDRVESTNRRQRITSIDVEGSHAG